MNRRTCLFSLAGAGLLTGCSASTEKSENAAPAAQPAPSGARPIQLHVDLQVDPAREQEMIDNYRNTFEPAIRKQPGFVAVTLLKLRDVMVGPGPDDAKYRLIISFQTEEQRKAWVATDLHQQVWPTIEQTLTGSKYTVLLYDPV